MVGEDGISGLLGRCRSWWPYVPAPKTPTRTNHKDAIKSSPAQTFGCETGPVGPGLVATQIRRFNTARNHHLPGMMQPPPRLDHPFSGAEHSSALDGALSRQFANQAKRRSAQADPASSVGACPDADGSARNACRFGEVTTSVVVARRHAFVGRSGATRYGAASVSRHARELP